MRKPREYKIKYFDRFRVQKEIWATTLDDSFFREWHNKLSAESEKNWHQSSTTCIRLLVEHQDAPEWLRDIYASHPRVEKRMVALLSRSGDYKYKNIQDSRIFDKEEAEHESDHDYQNDYNDHNDIY